MATYKIITRTDGKGRYWMAKSEEGYLMPNTLSRDSQEDCRKRLIAEVTEKASEQEVETVML